MPVQTQLQQRRGTAASWTSTNPTLAAGEIGFETDTGKFKIGNGSTAWAALAYSAGATAVTYLFNATSGQTTFSGADANGLTLAYTVGAEQVYLNGVLQVRGSDYTATNGTSIVLASGALTSDVLNVIAYSAMTVTDTYTQAQADAKFFQTANAFLAGKNKIINGDFGIWQRGTSLSGAGYLADRFQGVVTTTTITQSQQAFTAGTAPVAGYESSYFYRAVTVTGGTAGSRALVQQPIEDVRTFAGQTVTISFWAKAASGTPKIGVELAQVFGSGGSSAVTAIGATAKTISTSWARYSVTASVPSISGKTIGTGSSLNLVLWIDAGSDFAARASSIGNQSGTFDIWGVQVEAGSTATPFQTASGTLAGELAACQRYYWRAGGDTNFQSYGVGLAQSTTAAQVSVQNPVPMRVAPTSLDYSTLGLTEGISTTAATNVYFGNVGKYSSTINVTVASGLTAYRPYILVSNSSTSAYFGLNAEL